MDYQTITYAKPEPGIGLVTLNRPERMNAWTVTMMEELLDVLPKADADDDVRAVVMTGAGKAFCAGADLDPNSGIVRAGEADSGEVPRDTAGRVTLTVYDMKKPVIAAINGAAVGVGATVTLPMDIRIASEKAKFGFVFNRRGMVPEGCSTWFLPRIVGISQASEWILSGRVFTSREALERGLVSRVVPPEQLMPTAFELAREIADNTSAVSVALARQMLWRMLGADHPMEAHKLESRGLHYMYRSPDLLEGVVSFLEKRPPRFSMKPGADMPDYYPWWEDRPYQDT